MPMNERCTDPECPDASIENHAHMTEQEADEITNLVVAAIVHDLPAEGDED